MKLAVISDTHGNFPALQATLDHVDRWKPDLVVVNGDVVNRGPRSRQCWELMRERQETHGWRVVSGNHEDYVCRWLDEPLNSEDPRFQIYGSSYQTFRQLNGHILEIRKLPQQIELEGPEGTTVRFTHGTMRGNDDGILQDAPDSQLMKQISPAPDVFCTGHTHRPFTRRINGTLVVNSGSAGTTFDGDPRISYAQLTWRKRGWQAEIARVSYDRDRSRRDFETSEFRLQGGPLVEIFLQEWLLARPMVNRWAKQYEERVIAGEIDLQSSVSEFLQAEL